MADILSYREASKLKSTYVDALPAHRAQHTGRIHTHLHQLLTSTGRLASSDPNLQNIPVRSEMGRELRRAFVPRGPEFTLMAADYSQVELRVMAALSGDPAMIEAFQNDLDIHTATAARVFDVPTDELLFDLHQDEREELPPLITEAMASALILPHDVPVKIDTGFGDNWLEAH